MKKSILFVMLFCITGLNTFISHATLSPEEIKGKRYQVRKSHRLGTVVRAQKKINKLKTLQRHKEQKNKFTVNHHYFDYELYQ